MPSSGTYKCSDDATFLRCMPLTLSQFHTLEPGYFENLNIIHYNMEIESSYLLLFSSKYLGIKVDLNSSDFGLLEQKPHSQTHTRNPTITVFAKIVYLLSIQP